MNESDEIEITVDPSFLVTTALLFPCFADAKAMDDHDNLYEIMMSSYSEDNLTEAQDLVMELIFHLCSPEAQFNLHEAGHCVMVRHASWLMFTAHACVRKRRSAQCSVEEFVLC